LAHAMRFLQTDEGVGGRENRSIRPCATGAFGKKIDGKTKEGDRWWRRQGVYAPVLWGDEAFIFGLDFRINLGRRPNCE